MTDKISYFEERQQLMIDDCLTVLQENPKDELALYYLNNFTKNINKHREYKSKIEKQKIDDARREQQMIEKARKNQPEAGFEKKSKKQKNIDICY